MTKLDGPYCNRIDIMTLQRVSKGVNNLQVPQAKFVIGVKLMME